MSRAELKKYIPDSAKEWSFIGSAIVRLGSAMSGILIFAEKPTWILASAGLTWIGHEICEYFKIHQKETPKANIQKDIQ